MDDNYSKLVDIAYNKHISGKLEEAKSIYEKLLSFKPNDVNVLNLYAQLNVSIKNYDKALEIFQYIFNNTQLDSVQLNIAKVYMLKNNYNEAIGSLNLIQKKNESVLRLLASAYTNSENKDEAIKIYEDIINLKNPSFPDFYNISVLYSDKKNNDLALKYALMAYDLNSSDIDINLHLASLYENFSDYENALKYLLCISQINPEVNILYRIGVLYKKLSNDVLAVKYFNDILNIEPDNKDALLNIAFIYR
ncbi:MAG: tetratricopeptide repeat protein, partial [Candidatus Gastranaerophilales bacterium]|nr:tetratricopeptide repeat protein [Candidatus Gastranaerophilales bacterium]